MTLAPSVNLLLGAIVLGFGAGLGWYTAAWLVSLVTRRASS